MNTNPRSYCFINSDKSDKKHHAIVQSCMFSIPLWTADKRLWFELKNLIRAMLSLRDWLSVVSTPIQIIPSALTLVSWLPYKTKEISHISNIN